MPEEKTVFGMLEEISAGQSNLLNEIAGVKGKVSESDARIAELEKEIKQLKTQPTNVQPRPITNAPQPNNKEILQTFLKKAKKSWRWFGTKTEFAKWKTLAIVSLITLLLVGLITTIVTSISCGIYSTFTFFENAWMVFGIIYLVFASKSRLTYEVNALASNSSTKYETDHLGMKFPRKEKVVFRIFRWLAIISVIANIIFIWTRKSDFSVFATIMEVLFLGAIVFAFFMNLNLFAQYSIIWVEGHNLTTNEKVVLVLPPGAKQLMPEEEFKKKMPFFYE